MAGRREYTYLKSSNIRGAAYDNQSGTLYIEFTSGSEYAYEGVPPDEYEALVKAASPGGYFSANIRSVYDGVQV